MDAAEVKGGPKQFSLHLYNATTDILKRVLFCHFFCSTYHAKRSGHLGEFVCRFKFKLSYYGQHLAHNLINHVSKNIFYLVYYICSLQLRNNLKIGFLCTQPHQINLLREKTVDNCCGLTSGYASLPNGGGKSISPHCVLHMNSAV